MGQDNQDGLKKMLDFSRAIGIIFYLLNIYWFCGDFFSSILPENIYGKSYTFLQLADSRLHLFSSAYPTLVIALLFIGLYGWAERGKKEEKIQLSFFIAPLCDLLEKTGAIDRGENGRVVEENDNGKPVTKIRPVRSEGWCIIVAGLLITLVSPALLQIGQPFIRFVLYVFVSGLASSISYSAATTSTR